MMRQKEISETLKALGCRNYKFVPPEKGIIHFHNAEGTQIAVGEYQLIASYKPHKKYIRAWVLEDFVHVPIVKKLRADEQGVYLDLSPENALDHAVAIADQIGAEFVYHAKDIFVAVFNFRVAEDDVPPIENDAPLIIIDEKITPEETEKPDKEPTMIWREVMYMKGRPECYCILSKQDYWFSNLGEYVIGFSMKTKQVLWEKPRKNHTRSRDGVLAGNTVIFFQAPKNKSEEEYPTIQGYDLMTGEIRWERRLFLDTIGAGLITNGDWVLYSDRLPSEKEIYLICIDPQTGESYQKIPVGKVVLRLTKWHQTAETRFMTSGNRLIFNDYQNGCVYWVDIEPVPAESSTKTTATESDEADWPSDYVRLLKKIEHEKSNHNPPTGVINRFEAISDATLLDGNEQFVFINRRIRVGDETWYSLVCLECKTMQEVSHIDYAAPEKPHNIYALPIPGNNKQVIVTFPKGGMIRFDFEKEIGVWHIGREEAWHIVHVTWTPYGLFASTRYPKDKKYLLCIDLETGQELPFPKLKDSTRGNMSWNGSQLLINMSKGMQLFSWGEKPTPPPPIGGAISAEKSAKNTHHTTEDKPNTKKTDSSDSLLQDVVLAFLKVMGSQGQSTYQQNVLHFRALADTLFTAYPTVNVQDIVAVLVAKGIPHETAHRDILTVLGHQ